MRHLILVFITLHCAVFGYSKDHQLTALHQINEDNLSLFCKEHGKQYSLMKYGNKPALAEYAKRLSALISREWKGKIAKHPNRFAIVIPAYKKVPTSATALAMQISKELGIQSVRIGRVAVNSKDFGCLSDPKERLQVMTGQFFYDGPPLTGLQLLFIEDAVVSGAHYIETQKVLERMGGVDLKHLHGYCVVDVDPALNCAVESMLNHQWINGSYPERAAALISDPETLISPRVAKLALNTLSIIQKTSKPGLRRVLKAAKLDGLHLKDLHRPQVNTLLANLGRPQALKKFDRSRLDTPAAKLYSKMIHGDKLAVALYANTLALDITTKLAVDSERWAITAVDNIELAQKVGRELRVPFISPESENFPEHLIFIEGVVGSTDPLKAFRRVCEAKGAYVYPYAIFKIDPEDTELYHELRAPKGQRPDTT